MTDWVCICVKIETDGIIYNDILTFLFLPVFKWHNMVNWFCIYFCTNLEIMLNCKFFFTDLCAKDGLN